jgi:hypothetical protein
MKVTIAILFLLGAAGLYAHQNLVTGSSAESIDVAAIPNTEALARFHECLERARGPQIPESPIVCGTVNTETCADKHRILLHGEDGIGHCVLLSAISQIITIAPQQPASPWPGCAPTATPGVYLCDYGSNGRIISKTP